VKNARNRIIVVREDAYKQNTVYRPWADIISHKTNPISEPVERARTRGVLRLVRPLR